MAEIAERVSLNCRHAGSRWLSRQLAAMTRPAPSILGEMVADILGEVYGGLYHIDQPTLLHERTAWSDDRCITLTIDGELATHDGSELTWLVLLCHAHGIRLAIFGAAPRYVRLQFTSGEGQMFMGAVPSVARIVERFNELYVSCPSNNGGTNQ